MGVDFLGQTHKPKGGSGKKLQKCIEQEINIPTLNEQLLQTMGMSIYEGLQGYDPEVLRFVILPLSPSLHLSSRSMPALLSQRRGFRG